MSRVLFVLAALASLAASGCCLGGNGAAVSNGTGAPVPPPVLPSGEGLLPTPPPLFAGVSAPYPIVGGARGADGYVLRSGSATVQSVTGLAGVTQGSACSYTQYQVVAAGSFDCRWNVTCGGYVVYGLGTSGYQHCADPTWAAGTWMIDPSTSSADNDPSFVFANGAITVRDDYAGRNGAFTLTLTTP